MRVLLFFASSALALLLPPPISLSENLTLASSLANGPGANISTRGAISCLPALNGFDLKAQSCINAMRKIPRTTSSDVYGTRGVPATDVTIPIRYQSDDGRCVITLRLRKRDGTGQDVTRSVDVADAAGDIIDRCIIPRNLNYGGSAIGFSTFVPSDTYLDNYCCGVYSNGTS